MRALILAAAATLALSACDKSETQQAAANGDQAEAIANIQTNDTTAIDAATGEAANMADDVEFTAEDSENSAGNAAGNTAANRAEDE